MISSLILLGHIWWRKGEDDIKEDKVKKGVKQGKENEKKQKNIIVVSESKDIHG